MEGVRILAKAPKRVVFLNFDSHSEGKVAVAPVEYA